ncbi:HTH-type transcriptional repressor PurR [Roseovarius gaetbuli]|uniref:HTH-type transcriptional repressor PurR n=1 Tax=Roseovarius gaetbuli TaxID=1356575 RepID=A0A1X6Z5I2_9RHOB|nr:LacI family DNA-binding transcriptional regulator [Roseovarius gaetbuli]SLN40921.1 HTH-type transcriptional repressor PurR [Roseovarius gaetbuli]
MADKNNGNADIVAVAKAAKVSISTVSRAYNHPELVKPATRKKIDAAVRRLGYIRNRAAQTIHGIRSGTIGLVVPTIDHAIFAEVIQAFSDAVEPYGFTLLVASHGYDLEREYGALRKFLEHRVDGLALIGLDHSAESYNLIQRQDIPAISIWNYDKTSILPCVGADNRHAGELAARHLVDLGHRDIGMVFPPTRDNDRARDRQQGAMSVLADLPRATPKEWIVETPYSIADTKEAVTRMLSQPALPTAILCGNDVLAVGAIYAAMRCGLRVPDDISIIGIGDFKGSREMEPGLTTVRLPARTIGELAGKELARLVTKESSEIQRTSCDISVVARKTCRRVTGV